ncbi:MAG: metal ABC transporter permease [Clostridium sp.]|nr:metal ABC transporter permease [Clostridium sp.]
MIVGLEIQLIAIITAMACSLVGVFLIIRNMAMVSDAITHTVLLGIVIGFFITKNINSPLLIIFAAIMGVITVVAIESLQNTKLLSTDASTGVVFPFFFSIAIILISKFAGSVHLDVDAVLLGELAFAPFNRLILFGVDIGPIALYTSLVMLLINLIFIYIFYKELQINSFDVILGSLLGFTPLLIHYLLMTLVSMTTVVAFETAGSILVIAFMVGPAITARLITDDLKKIIGSSLIFSIFNAIIGYQIAYYFDVSIAGSMAVITGLTFLVVSLFSKKSGVIVSVRNYYKQQRYYYRLILMYQLTHHEKNITLDDLLEHISWDEPKKRKVLKECINLGWIDLQNNRVNLTKEGNEELEYFDEHYLV